MKNKLSRPLTRHEINAAVAKAQMRLRAWEAVTNGEARAMGFWVKPHKVRAHTRAGHYQTRIVPNKRRDK